MKLTDQINKLAVERALQIAEFGNFHPVATGEIRPAKRKLSDVEDSPESFLVDVLEIPVRVELSNFKAAKADLIGSMLRAPRQDGFVVIPEFGEPFLEFDERALVNQI